MSEKIVNDIAIKVATVNGSGSQSANNIITKTLFRMGIPVGGKNIFPSNIAGLPTWYVIRANKDGYVSRKEDVDMVIAMNSQTLLEDVEELRSGGVVIYNSDFNMADEHKREDVIWYPVPFTSMARDLVKDVKMRKLLTNMIYVGFLAPLLGLDEEVAKKAISDNFAGKKKAVDINYSAFDLGSNYYKENFEKKDNLYVEKMDANQNKVMLDGNAAGALGSLFGGATFLSWYPITPSSSLCETLISLMKEHRVDENGKNKFSEVQAEDELAAIGMVIGAGWAGARSLTATSGPGMSLMAEFMGLAYFAEIPSVLWNIQRVGPSTGMPTRTNQGDLLSAYTLSHGDTKHIVLIPSSIKDCFEYGQTSLDLAERLQAPVIVLSDLDLGMNNWMTDEFDYPEKPYDRGKVLNAEDLDRVGKFERYRDVDGDGIPYRTLPGTKHDLASYFTRGTSHDEKSNYTEKSDVYLRVMDRLQKKYETAKEYIPAPVIDNVGDSKVGIIAYGSTDSAMREARDQLKAKGIETNYLLVKSLPLRDEIKDFISNNDRVYLIEQNRDAQMYTILRMEYGSEYTDKITSILHYSGLTINSRSISDPILQKEEKKQNVLASC